MLEKIRDNSRSAGFTFTELLIALIINTLLLAALITVFSANIRYFKTTVNASRLNQQMQTAMNIMASDIRRAGYWSNARNDLGSATNNNPFMVTATDISINAGGNCILLTYDRSENGTLPAIDASIDDERYGYRLTNQAIQSRPPGAPFDCDTTSSNWENITDTGFMQITNLSFTLTTKTVSSGSGNDLIMRSIDISMTGRLTSDTSVTKTITQHDRVRNDKFT